MFILSVKIIIIEKRISVMNTKTTALIAGQRWLERQVSRNDNIFNDYYNNACTDTNYKNYTKSYISIQTGKGN